MALPPKACDAGRLDLLLRGSLPEVSRRELEAHLPHCPACRAALDELAGGAPWWAEVRRYLADDPADPGGATGGAAGAGADETLDFLGPSDSPGALGRLGPYEVLEVLGRGAFGVVLKALDPALNRPVAIKVLAARYAASEGARRRFAREARAAAAVSHDHVVAVHAVDASATPPYLVMAFIPGQSLQQRLDRGGPLALAEVLRIGMQTAAGLAAAHAQGIVHRDVKPANIMLENGVERVRLTDFGLARAVDDASVTTGGAVAGTPQYMAPEQARAEAVDHRADLFALGSVLYAMCAGRAPFHGCGTLAVLRQVCDAEPAPLRSLNPAVPAWLAGIVRKLHAKAPEDRFASAAEVADLLAGCLAHVQQPHRHPLPPAAAALGWGAPGRTRRRLMAGALLLAAVAAGVALWRCWPDGGPEPSEAERPRLVVPAARPAVPAPSERDVEDRVGRLRSRAADLEQSLSEAAPGAAPWPEAALAEAGRQVEQLRQDLGAGRRVGPDAIDLELDVLRRRLDALRRRVGATPE